MRPRGKGRKLAWPGAWYENTKGTAQLRSFFVNVDERVRSWGVGEANIQTYDLRIEAVYVGEDEDENQMIMYC